MKAEQKCYHVYVTTNPRPFRTAPTILRPIYLELVWQANLLGISVAGQITWNSCGRQIYLEFVWQANLLGISVAGQFTWN